MGTLILEIPWPVKLLLVLMIITYWTVKPKEDLLLNREELVLIKRSMIPSFTKSEAYQTSSITSFRIKGVHNSKWELIDFLNGGSNTGGISNLVEISFRDGSSTSLNLRIDRAELDQVRNMIYKLNAERSNQ